MSIYTGISITLACILLASLLWVLAEERDKKRKEEQDAKERRYLLFKMAQADMQLQKDVADATFEFAENYGRVLHYPEDFENGRIA